MENVVNLSNSDVEGIIRAVHDQDYVSGLTHGYYRYPARFSPLFAREIIKNFSKSGDLILDPFMGGGTTLVEAIHLGRRALGVDISSLATFIGQVKTTVLTGSDDQSIRQWAKKLPERLILRNSSIRPIEWIESGYQRNINTRRAWPIRKSLELALAYIEELPIKRQQNFARCLLLKTGQWALDSRKTIPSAEKFRVQLTLHLEEMLFGMEELRNCLILQEKESTRISKPKKLCINRNATGLEFEPFLAQESPPKLILTSPPYPGIHVLYHRWQVLGRRETPSPFWIANCLDGRGESFYTFGHREEQNLKKYFKSALATFTSLAMISDSNTLLVQTVGFSDRSWQLPAYLETLEHAGFIETQIPEFANSSDGRLWRIVPNRKWYADQLGETGSCKEVVLFHRLANPR